MTLAQRITDAETLLYRYSRENAYVDVLIDRMATIGAEEDWQAWYDAGELAPLNDPMFNVSPHKSPVLVRIPTQRSDILQAMVSKTVDDANPFATLRPICAFVFNDASLNVLTTRLSRPLNATAQGVGSFYFRYFDPRVWSLLPDILEPEQISLLFAGARRWLCTDHDGTLRDHAPPLVEPIKAPAAQRMVVSGEQWQRLAAIELVSPVSRRFAEHGFPLPEANRVIKAGVQAQTLFKDTDDQTTYVAYLLLHQAAFTQHPRYEEAIALTQRERIPLRDVLEQKLQMPFDAGGAA